MKKIKIPKPSNFTKVDEIPILEPIDFEKQPKKKIAVMVGYNGKNYTGSQRRGTPNTVELKLEEALFKLKMIHPKNFGDPGRSKFK
jgi:hypothetical protein